MAQTTITLFQNKSSKQATDYSFGMSLSEVSALIDNALPDYAVIEGIELQLSCRASVSLGYANITTYVCFCDTDSHANLSGYAERLITKSYKTTDGVQTGTIGISSFFQSKAPYTKRNTNYSRIAVYFDTTNITQKTFTCDYLRLKITYEIEDPTRTITTKVSPPEGGTISGGGDYLSGSKVTITATPNAGYKFVRCDMRYAYNAPDYVAKSYTESSFTIECYADMVFTAYFELDKINNISVDTSLSAMVWADTEESSEIFADTTKVYG